MRSGLAERRVGAQVPRLHQLPAGAAGSAGDDAIEWAESIGWDDDLGHGFYVLDEWQRFCIRGILSEDETARLCAEIALLIVARQNGKGTILEVVELYALFVLDLPLILHTAHLGETSADHMGRLWAAIQSDPELASQCHMVRAKGSEAIERNGGCDLGGGEIRFRTRSEKGGRGGSPQMVVFDEALFLTAQQQSATVPSLSAQTMRDDKPLMIYASSAPLGRSEVLHNVRSSVLRGEMPQAFMAEWSVELPDTDGDLAAAIRAVMADPEAIYQANPGVGIRIDPQWCLTTERGSMTPEAWCIERLGVVFTADGDAGVLPGNLWTACHDATSTVDGGRIALAVGPGSTWAAVGLAGERADGSLHLEVVRHALGTDWLVGALRAGTERYGPVLVDPKSPTMAVLTTLETAGIEVEELATADVTRACAELQNDLKALHLRHLDQPELNAAVAGAGIRPVGESWVFSAKASTVDVCPLLAVTLAAHGARVSGSVDPLSQIF
ncbi:MAG: hypothetical protein R2761_16205 [Acidimicrobiales bacterium]